jgi:hypothetical protein
MKCFALLLVLILTNCANKVDSAVFLPPVNCPPPLAKPANPPKIRSLASIASFAIRLQEAREQERKRGDECSASLDAVLATIKNHPR